MYLRVSLTDRCNLRCTYCLPEQAAFATTRARYAELAELMALVARAVPIGKIRLTGGEPTLSPHLVEAVGAARRLAGEVVMTSNGLRLEPLLPALRAAGLDRVTVSLDAVDPDVFRAIARRDGLAQVLGAIRAVPRAGFPAPKVNAVATVDTDFAGLVRMAIAEGVHLRFIELMAIGEARADHAERFIPAEAQRERLALAGIRLRERADLDEPTSRVWAIDGHDPARVSVGFITTVTRPFCATCDRLRLSSQGRLHTCLMDDAGVDLLGPLRAGRPAEVVARIRLAVAGKRPPAVMERVGVMAGIGG